MFKLHSIKFEPHFNIWTKIREDRRRGKIWVNEILKCIFPLRKSKVGRPFPIRGVHENLEVQTSVLVTFQNYIKRIPKKNFNVVQWVSSLFVKIFVLFCFDEKQFMTRSTTDVWTNRLNDSLMKYGSLFFSRRTKNVQTIRELGTRVLMG